MGSSHPAYAAALSNLAVLRRAAGDHAAAAPLFRRALEIFEARRRSDGEKRDEAGRAHQAAIFRALGFGDRAEELADGWGRRHDALAGWKGRAGFPASA